MGWQVLRWLKQQVVQDAGELGTVSSTVERCGARATNGPRASGGSTELPGNCFRRTQSSSMFGQISAAAFERRATRYTSIAALARGLGRFESMRAAWVVQTLIAFCREGISMGHFDDTPLHAVNVSTDRRNHVGRKALLRRVQGESRKCLAFP